MWSWNQFRNLPKNQTLSAAEQARQYFIHQSNMMMEASINNSVSVSAAGSAGGSQKSEITTTLRLLFDDISNADMIVGDSSSVDDWNIFFDLPNLGVAFTSVEISGNEVSLIGGSNIKVKPGLMYSYTENVFLIKIEDTGSITSVGGDAFSYCDGLTDVVLPECTIVYGWDDSEFGDWGGFGGCSVLVNLSAPKLVTAEKGAFPECSLVIVDLPLVTSVGYQCFSNCELLTTINLPLVTSVGGDCFSQCISLTNINLPLCTDLGGTTGDNDIFDNIVGNTIYITINESVLEDLDLFYLSIDNTIIVNDLEYLPYTGYTGDLVLEFDNTTSIGLLVADISSVEDWNTFFDLPSWSTAFTSVDKFNTTITLQGGENIVIKNIFTSNTNLISIVDLGCVVYLDNNCLQGCTSLETIDLPNLTTAGSSCFNSCTSLTTINLPNLTTAGEYFLYSCTSLTTIDLPNLTTAGGSCFNNSGLTTVSLPSLTTVGDYCFSGCFDLVNISLPALTIASNQCFQSCTSLTTVDFPALTTTGDQCFNECTLLTSISLPLCTSLGSSVGINQVFGNISGNTITLTIPASLMTINGGDPDEDIQKLTDDNTVTIITT